MSSVIIPVWNASVKYPLGAVVSYSGGYYVAISGNYNTVPTTTASWSLFSDVSGAQPSTLGDAPVNAVAAASTLTFTGDAIDGDTVTIGVDVYEFDTNAAVTLGNILVDVSGGATAPAAVTALVTAITASTTEPVTAVDGAGNTVVVTADVAGTDAESIVTTQTLTNGTWNNAHLDGGVDGTLGIESQLAQDGDYLYVCTGANTVADANWKWVGLVDSTPTLSTAALTLLTHSAPGTPDYAIQQLVQPTGFGFATADEGNTVLAVILNLQLRVAILEAALTANGTVV